MILISHRGNLHGPNPPKENSPDYLLAAIAAGFHVEVDVWSKDNHLFLGHDAPQTPTTLDFLSTPNFWLHAKNIPALLALRKANLHCFFHHNDDATLTSHGYIWTYPAKPLTPLSIAVLPEQAPHQQLPPTLAGICSDFIANYRK